MRSALPSGLGVAIALALGAALPASADGPAPPPRILPRPFDRTVYAPAGVLPPGYKPVRLVDCRGALGRVDVHQISQTCMALESGFVAQYTSDWQSGLDALDVRVSMEHAPAARTDREWLAALWRHVHGGRAASARELRRWGARVWRGDGGRSVEWGGASSCCGGDRLTYVVRFVERDGYVLRLELRVYDFVRPEEMQRLRQLFVDGPLGAPPAPAPAAARR